MGKRPDGEGLVRKRKDGRWEGRIVVGHKLDGSPIKKSVFAKTQKELIPKLKKLISDYEGIELTEDSEMTVREWLEKWLNDYCAPKLRPSTLRGYTSACKKMYDYIGDKRIRSLTTADCQRMYNLLKNNGRKTKSETHGTQLSNTTIRGFHMVLHEAMDAARIKRLIACNPTEGTRDEHSVRRSIGTLYERD